MPTSTREIWLAGIDGCPSGWVVALARADLSELRVRLVARFIDVTAALEAPAVIAIDIPIGLPESAGYGGRAAENAVRPLFAKSSRAKNIRPIECDARLLTAIFAKMYSRTRRSAELSVEKMIATYIIGSILL